MNMLEIFPMKTKRVSIPIEMYDSINQILKAYKDKGIIITKTQLLLSIYYQWLDEQVKEIEKIERKNNA